MKLQKLALTALALSMSAAFAAGNTGDKQAQGYSGQTPMAQDSSTAQPSPRADQAASSANQAAPSADQAASGSTNGSQSGMSSRGASAHSDPQVRQVQQALKDKGHDPGPIDGIMGPRTQGALQSFQQAQGISGSGQLDAQTLAALGVQGDGTSASSLSSSANPASSSGANQASSSGTDQAASSSANQASSTDQGSSGTNQTKQ